MCTLLFTFNPEEVQPKEEHEKIEYTIGAAAAKTPTNLSKDNEREDICKWAKKQDGYKKSSRSPITAFHQYFGKSNDAWCQMFMNWCSIQAGLPDSNFVRKNKYGNCFLCADCLAGYDNLKGYNRKAGKKATPVAGWLIYETYSSKPNHVGMYVGNGEWAHGNYDGGQVKVVTQNYGSFVSYAKPFYRSKIYYNTNY